MRRSYSGRQIISAFWRGIRESAYLMLGNRHYRSGVDHGDIYLLAMPSLTCFLGTMKMTDLPDIVGIFGAIISIYFYARVQWEREYVKKLGYSLGNFVGTIMLLFSLVYHFNAAAFLSNMAWGLISLYGVYRCLKYSWLEKKAGRQVGGV
jgi:hypothetical protein